MAASRGDAPRIRLLKAERDGEPDELQEIFAKKEALSGFGTASHVDGLALPMLLDHQIVTRLDTPP